MRELVERGVEFTAISLHQLEEYGRLLPGTNASVRINPDIGSGHSVKTNVGGATSNFGIWHEYIPKVHEIITTYKLRIIRRRQQRIRKYLAHGTYLKLVSGI
jgi:diaminopimelate decarboxylase